ncbi:MAG: hypothetical protein ABFD86_13490, partial [Bryobacteraceae bacterium]
MAVARSFAASHIAFGRMVGTAVFRQADPPAISNLAFGESKGKIRVPVKSASSSPMLAATRALSVREQISQIKPESTSCTLKQVIRMTSY